MLATWYFFFLKFIFPFVFESRDDLFANARSLFFFRSILLSLSSFLFLSTILSRGRRGSASIEGKEKGIRGAL